MPFGETKEILLLSFTQEKDKVWFDQSERIYKREDYWQSGL